MTEIKKTIIIEAPPSAIFRALTDEKALTAWFPNQARLEARWAVLWNSSSSRLTARLTTL